MLVSECASRKNAVVFPRTRPTNPGGVRVALLSFALAWSLQPASLAATNPDTAVNYEVKTWNTPDGLPNPSVLALSQTPDGYLWCGTEAGLARFDGIHFVVFDGQNAPELGNAQIQSLFVDQQGALWISTRNGRLVRFRDGVFTAYHLPKRASLAQAILNFTDDEEGGLWVMPMDRPFLMRFANGQFRPATNLWPGGPVSFNIRSGFDGSVWMSSGDTLAHRDRGEVKTVKRSETGHCRFHAPSRTGGFWVSTEGRMGIWKDKRWLWQGEKLPQNIVDALQGPLQWGVEDNLQRMWLASSGAGVFCFDTNANVLHFTTAHGLPTDNARFILVDREDDVWVATDNGLIRIRPALFRVYDHRQGLNSDRVTGVWPAPQGGLWIGTDDGGLHQLRDGNIIAPTSSPPYVRITAVLTDNASNTWVATHGAGLFRSTPGGFTRVGDASLTGEVSALFEDTSNRLWVGQRSLNTIACREPDNKWRSLTLPNHETIIDVRCFAEDNHKGLWVGTHGSGLYWWDGVRFAEYNRTNGLPSDLISTLYFDREDHTLWIGTGGGGLVRWKDGQFAICNASRGLWDNTICQLLDDQGWFWFGSRRGVFRVSKAELRRFMDGVQPRIYSTAYGLQDGLPTLVCSGDFQPAGCRSADGRLWFPTTRGLAWVDPTSMPASLHPPVVQIERVLLNGEELRNVLMHNAAVSTAPAFEIPPGAQRCEFQYTGLSFEDPEAVQFKYRLEGLEQDWIQAGTARSAAYSRLPPGDYCFTVTAANREGIWNDTGAKLRFRMLPEFWQTAWFLSACLGTGTVLLVGAGWIVARSRARHHLAHMARANAIERERTRIARDIHDDLGTGLTHIGWLSELAVTDAGNAEKVGVHTAKIADHARHLVKSLDATVWAVSPQNDSLESLARYISNHAHDTLEAAGINCRMDIPADLPSTPLSAEVRHDLYLAVKEALNNLLKHAGARTAHLRFAVQDGSLIIILDDDGHGFDPAQSSGGHGLNNMRSRLEQLGGEFHCDSAPGRGTQLTFRLPLRQRQPT